MRKLNFRIQSIFIGLAFIMGIAAIMKIEEVFFCLLWFQLFVGIVQMIVALKLISMKRTRTLLLEIYLASSIIFLVLFFGSMDEMMQLARYAFVIVPWCLAVLFWYISYELYKKELK